MLRLGRGDLDLEGLAIVLDSDTKALLEVLIGAHGDLVALIVNIVDGVPGLGEAASEEVHQHFPKRGEGECVVVLDGDPTQVIVSVQRNLQHEGRLAH